MKRRDFLISASAIAFASMTAKAQSPNPAPPPLSAFAASPHLRHLCLSPDAKKVAYLSDIDGKQALLAVPLDGTKPTAVPLEGFKVRDLLWAGPEHVVLISSVTSATTFYYGDKHELKIAHVINTTTGKVNQLFNGMPYVHPRIEGEISIVKRDNVYSLMAATLRSNSINPEVVVNLRFATYFSDGNALYEFDLKTNHAKVVDAGTLDTYGWIISPDGTPIARQNYDFTSHNWRLQVTEKQSWKDSYLLSNTISLPYVAGLSRDGLSPLVYMNSGPLDGSYVEINAQGQISAPLNTNNAAQTPIFHPLTKRHVGFVSADGSVYDVFDPLMASIIKEVASATEGERSRILQFAEDPRKVLLRTEGPGNAGNNILIDFGSGDATVIGSDYPGIPTEWVVEKQPLKYKAADGLEINAYLTLPPFREAKNLPLIVLPHGGPQSHDTLSFDWEAQAYASRGYAVLQPNFRGSSGYGKAFVEAGYGQWGKKMQTDLSDGVRHLAKLGTIDPKRVAISGASYGGYAALAGAAFDSGIYQCAISVAGLTDLSAFLEWEKQNTGSGHSPTVAYWKQFWADVVLDSISPAKHVDSITIPILLIHGKNDTVVPIDQSRRMNKAMKAAGKDVTFIEFDKEDHWQSLAPARLEMIEAVMAFLDKHNPAFI